MPYCPNCGSEIGKRDQYCHNCGTNLSKAYDGEGESSITVNSGRNRELNSEINASAGHETLSTDDWTSQYPTLIWVASLIMGLITFPIGLFIPGYFFFKSKNPPVNQPAFEAWTVILLGIFGILAVEIGGRRGAKILWGIVLTLFVLFMLLVFMAMIFA